MKKVKYREFGKTVDMYFYENREEFMFYLLRRLHVNTIKDLKAYRIIENYLKENLKEQTYIEFYVKMYWPSLQSIIDDYRRGDEIPGRFLKNTVWFMNNSRGCMKNIIGAEDTDFIDVTEIEFM